MEYLHEKFRHHHHHHVDEMTCRDDEKIRMRRNGVPCHDHFEGDGLTFNGTVYHDTFQFKKSTNIVGSWKVGGIWSLGFLRILKRSKVPLVGEHGLTVVRNFEDLTELGKSESYEFMLNHKGDDKIAIFIGLNRDLTIEIKNESWNNRFVDFKETIEANVYEETLDVVGFVVGLINNTTFVNVAIFNGFVEFGNCGGNAEDFGYFWDVGFEPLRILVKLDDFEVDFGKYGGGFSSQQEELIRENVFGLGGHRDHLPACLAHMLYCVVAEEQYNLAYFFVKRIECARANPTANSSISSPLALKQTRRPRSDRGKARHSVSSSSSHHHGTSSHQHDDDDDVETSRASTPSPTTYLNSLNPLNYQNYEMPSASEQTDETLFERQTTLLNQTQEMHKEERRRYKSFERH
ncbi:hypothetical protein Tco_0869826 [Tanacetum coccineum]